MHYKRQELLTFRQHMGSIQVFGRFVLLIFVFCVLLRVLFVFVLFVFFLCRQCLWGVPSWLPFRFYLTYITTDQRLATDFITIGSNMCWHWTINFSGDWRWLYSDRSMTPQLFRQTAQWSVHWSWQLINSTAH